MCVDCCIQETIKPVKYEMTIANTPRLVSKVENDLCENLEIFSSRTRPMLPRQSFHLFKLFCINDVKRILQLVAKETKRGCNICIIVQ